MRYIKMPVEEELPFGVMFPDACDYFVRNVCWQVNSVINAPRSRRQNDELCIGEF